MALDNNKSLVVSHEIDDLICNKRDDLEEGEIEDDDTSNDGINVGKPDGYDRNTINNHNTLSALVPSVEVHDKEILTSHTPQFKSNYTTSIGDSSCLDRLTEGDEKTSVTHVGEVEKYMNFPKTRKRKRHNKHVEGIESVLISKLKRNTDKIESEKTERDASHSSENEAVNDNELLFVRGASPIICNDYNHLSHYERKISDRANCPLVDNPHYQLHTDEDNIESSTGSCDSPASIIRSHSKKGHKLGHKELSKKKRRLKKKHHNDYRNNSKRRNRKMKLCKYYVAGSCSKKEKCLYMHSKFPCKFYHTGLLCFAGDRCKFSHKARNKNMQSLLDTHQKIASKEMKYGHNNICTSIGKKKIPSLLEIEVPIPPQLLTRNTMFREDLRSSNKYDLPVSEEGGSHTPMPSSPKYDSQNQYGNFAVTQPEDMNDLRDSNNEKIHQLEDIEVKHIENRGIEVETKSNKQITRFPAWPTIASQECYENEQLENNFVPLNLPKKQRELFLRVQQQQKEATTSNILTHQKESELKRINDTKGKKIIEEAYWYSSDEEDASLTNVLKNLSSQTSLNSCKELSHKEISESVSRIFSSIKLQTKNITFDLKGTSASTSQLAEHTDALIQVPTMQARDPRLASRDLRSRSNITASAGVPSIWCCTQFETSPSKKNTTNCYNSPGKISIYNSTAAASSSGSSNEIQIGQSGAFPFSGIETINFGDGGDVGCRKMFSSQDLQTGKRNDVDLRQTIRPLTSSFSLICGDTDLRRASLSGDVDLREIMGFPFNPVHIHKPATEIDASLHSHLPIRYKLVPIKIPRPNFSGLKVNKADPHVLNDPRLRKLFHLPSNNLNNIVPVPLQST